MTQTWKTSTMILQLNIIVMLTTNISSVFDMASTFSTDASIYIYIYINVVNVTLIFSCNVLAHVISWVKSASYTNTAHAHREKLLDSTLKFEFEHLNHLHWTQNESSGIALRWPLLYLFGLFDIRTFSRLPCASLVRFLFLCEWS